MTYKIVKAMTTATLTIRVNNNIEAGFVLLGGVCHGEGSYLYQAMMIDEEDVSQKDEADAEKPFKKLPFGHEAMPYG